MKKQIIILLVIVVGVAGFVFFQGNSTENVEDIVTNEQIGADMEPNLLDVTNGEDVRGINTGGNSFGTAKAVYIDNYELNAVFGNLPIPIGTDFYEGWVVRRGESFSVISTGELEFVDGVYINNFTSEDNFIDHNFYVLTLEPDDGDPAPADHIVEGEIN